MKRLAIAAVFILFLLSGCNRLPDTSQSEKSPMLIVQEIAAPIKENTAEPELTTTDGRVVLSWFEKTGEKKYALRFSTRENEKWSDVQTIAKGENFFVNWADFPSVVMKTDKTLTAHWLVKSAAKPYAYDVNIAFSSDGGKSWTKPMKPHTDNTETEHGFVSLLDLDDGKTGVVWLDGRKFQGAKEGETRHDGHDAKKEMTLRYAAIDKDGKLFDETELDGRVCDCCQTSAAKTSDGAIVVYRDRTEEEIRDISAVRFVNGGWEKPQKISTDNWNINGCPVNGPVVAAKEKQVAVVWYTEAESQHQVKVAFSNDAGATFGQPVIVDDGKAMGRTDLLMLDDGSVLVVWLAGNASGAEIKCRRVKPYGTMDDVFKITDTSIERKSGFPRIAQSGKEIIFAWTDIATSRVRVAVAKL
jgi:hypothetical protein